MQQAKVFLFDEPLSNLDAKLRTEMRVELKRLHKELGATIIYVTHDQIEAMTLATRIAVMRDGRIEQYAEPEVLYQQPQTLFVASFVGSPAMNVLAGYLTAGDMPAIRLETAILPIPNYEFSASVGSGRPVLLGIRPENIQLAPDHPTNPVIEAETLFLEPMGADTLAWFQFGSQRISARLPPLQARGLQGRVRLMLDMNSVSLFEPDTQARV